MNSEKNLHIVSFDYPFPPKYGGVIDVFYKIKALKSIGYTIYLHCFVSKNQTIDKELQDLVTQCYLYPQKKTFSSFFSFLPFSVNSRNAAELALNLKKNKAPILFESCKVTAVLEKNSFAPTLLRLHNVESAYFWGIAKSETNGFMKLNYYLEALKFRQFEKKTGLFDAVLTLSQHEQKWSLAQNKQSYYIPLFHGNDKVAPLSAFGSYAIYSGDMRTSDNRKAVRFLIAVFAKIPDYKLIIAVSDKVNFVEKHIGTAQNISVVQPKNYEHLQALLAEAHINVMVSFQASGTKLKLVNALFNTRHCLVNQNMVDDADILSLCELASSKAEFTAKIKELRNKPYNEGENRKNILSQVYNDVTNAQKIDAIIKNLS